MVAEIEREKESKMAELNERDEKVEFRLPLLEEDNYVIWKWKFKGIMYAKKLIGLGKNPEDIDSNKNAVALALLQSSLNDENSLKVINCTDFVSAWKCLEQCHETKTNYEPQSLFRQLNSYKIRNVAEVSASIGEMQGIRSQLINLGETVSDNNMMGAILSALPPAFDVFATVWKNTSEADRNVDTLISRIMSEAAEMLKKEDSKDSKAYATQMKKRPTQTKKPRDNDECRFCHEKGHWIKDCPNLKTPYDPNYSKNKSKKNFKDKANNKPKDKEDDVKDSDKKIEFGFVTKMNNCPCDQNIWMADSACTSHLTPYKQIISNFIEEEREIEWIDENKTKMIS